MWKKIDILPFTIVVVPLAIILGLAIWVAIENWNECRQTHSWLYCNAVLSKR